MKPKIKIHSGNCKKIGMWDVGDGGQNELTTWRCKDRVNCNSCGFIYTKTSGRLDTVEQAIADGAFVYTLPKNKWNSARTVATRQGMDSYIKLNDKYGENCFVITDFVIKHKNVVIVEDVSILNFYEIIRFSVGSNQFKGKYALTPKDNDGDNLEMDSEYKVYFPIFAYRDTNKIVSPTMMSDAIMSRMYINPKFGKITSDNVHDFMVWRAEVVASIVALDKPELKLVGFYERVKPENKARLDAGEAITNRVVESKEVSGPPIRNAVQKFIDEIQFDDVPTLFKLSDFPIVTGSWDYNDGVMSIDQDRELMDAYGKMLVDWIDNGGKLIPFDEFKAEWAGVIGS